MPYGLAGILSGLLTAFFAWRHAGPYRWIADLQQAAWGVNILQLSLVVCFVVFYVPLHFAARHAERRLGVSHEQPAWKRLVAAFEFLTGGNAGKAMLVGLVMSVMGGWFWISAATSGPLTTLSVARAERGERPASRHVRLEDARILFNIPLTFTRDGHEEHYYPVISDADATEPEKLVAFVKLDPSYVVSPPKQLEGELEFDGLPGALRAQLADKGFLQDGYFVLLYGRNPEEQVGFLAGMSAVGLCVFAFGWVWAKRQKPARRRPTAPTSGQR